MAAAVRVGVVGNCQGGPLSTLLKAVLPHVETPRIVTVHLAKTHERDAVYADFEGADLILAQRVVDDYPCEFVRTGELRAAFGEKVIVWPNLYFRGYNPELIYLRSPRDGRVIQGPLGDYHVSLIHEAWQQGLSTMDTVQRCQSVELNEERFQNVPDQSLNQLRKREEQCDVHIADMVADDWRSRRLFFTFNHPTKAALLELVREVVTVTSLGSPEAVGELPPSSTPAEPLGRWRAPTNPWIAQHYGVKGAGIETFQGNDVDLVDGVPRAMKPVVQLSLAELVESYFRVYDAALPASRDHQ